MGGGSNARGNTPVASSEQNLAIRQLGAEAAKIAASKKPAPVKISTTNPLLTEKTNAKSPADVLSPKSTPLPQSPNTAATYKPEGETKKLPAVELPDILSPKTPAAVPKLEQKPVHAPPSMHDDAANSALSAGPIKTTQAKEQSSEGESSEEEEDSDEEESSEDSTAAKKIEETQAQDPKDASKAGVSVKEGEPEEEGSEAKSEEVATEKKAETKPADAKEAAKKPQPEESSSEETSEEEDDDESEEDEEDEEEEETKKDEVKKTQTQDPKDASKAGESVLD